VRRLPVFPLLFLGLCSAPVLHAQFDSTTLAGRAVLRRVARLERDPRLKDFMAAGGFDNPHDPWGNGPVDDSTVILMVDLMARAIERDDGPICRSLTSDGSDDFLAAFVAAFTDSLEAEQWADMIERGVWSTNRRPGLADDNPRVGCDVDIRREECCESAWLAFTTGGCSG